LVIYSARIDDIRAALDWSFSPEGDEAIGVRLTIASTPVWFQLSIVDEYRRRMEQALEALKSDPTSSDGLEMKLNSMLGYALMHTKGPGPGMIAAFTKALDIAGLLGDTGTRWRALWGLGMAQVAGGDYPSAVHFSERAYLDSMQLDDDASIMSERLRALTFHFAGDQVTGRRCAERVLNQPVGATSSFNNDAYHLSSPAAPTPKPHARRAPQDSALPYFAWSGRGQRQELALYRRNSPRSL
jgi:hypothetical protein